MDPYEQLTSSNDILALIRDSYLDTVVMNMLAWFCWSFSDSADPITVYSKCFFKVTTCVYMAWSACEIHDFTDKRIRLFAVDATADPDRILYTIVFDYIAFTVVYFYTMFDAFDFCYRFQLNGVINARERINAA